MEIMSFSVSKELIQEIDLIEKEFGYKGKSEIIREAINLLIQEKKELNKLKGNVNAVLLVLHEKKYEKEIIKVKHLFNELIKTQIHSCLDKKMCLETFILFGNANKINEMLVKFKISKKSKFVKLFLT